MDDNYKKSLNRCPLCGTLVGCIEVEGLTVCSTEEFHQHVTQCREESKLRPGKIRYNREWQ